MRERTNEPFGLNGVLVPGEGFRITSVEPDSLAARLGLECGDLVTRVFGFPPEHADVYRVLTDIRPAAAPMSLVIRDKRGYEIRKIHIAGGEA